MIGPPLAPDDYPPGAATLLALMDALGIGGGTLHRVAEGGEGGDITDPAMVEVEPAKRCRVCQEIKPLSAFYRNKTRGDGFKAECKPCQARDDAVRTKSRVDYYAAYRDTHREQGKAHAAKQRADNPEGAKEYFRANRDKFRDLAARRRARERNAPVVERIYRAKVWERDGGICHICGLPADPALWHLEHIIPLARGGEHSYRNVAVSHPICNAHKGCGRGIMRDITDTTGEVGHNGTGPR